MSRIVLILLLFISVAVPAGGQHRLSAGIRGGYPFSPEEELLGGRNSKGKPLKISAAADVQYAFMLPGEIYQGIGMSVFSLFDHEDVGTPLSVYVFQGARIARFSPSLSLDYEWNFGASFGWHRQKDSPFNTIMGTRVNAYVNAGIMISWQPSENWKISAGPDMTHYSNGHTDLPNAGINTIGLRLDAARTFGEGKALRNAVLSMTESRKDGKFSCDITVFGALKKTSVDYNGRNYIVEGRFGTFGLHVNPFYDIHRHFRFGLSVDLNYDESANISDHIAGMTSVDAIRFFRPPLSEQVSLGLSVRTELVMPIFSVHFGVGHNIIYKGKDLDGLYQIIALKTHIVKGLYIHTGYQFRQFRYPDHLLLGLGWKF